MLKRGVRGRIKLNMGGVEVDSPDTGNMECRCFSALNSGVWGLQGT